MCKRTQDKNNEKLQALSTTNKETTAITKCQLSTLLYQKMDAARSSDRHPGQGYAVPYCQRDTCMRVRSTSPPFER